MTPQQVQHKDSSRSSQNAVSRESISAAYTLIKPHIRRTPVIEAAGSELDLGSIEIVLKLELFQHSGSFKARGAFMNLLGREIPQAGVVAATGGNHGVAVAYVARKLGIPAKIFVPAITSPAKLARLREYGAEICVVGERYADALAASEIWARESGAFPVHAFDSIETVLGQGTVALEFEEQVPELDTLLVAVGGGGLIGGIAAWYEGSVKIVAVEPIAAPTLHKALEAGEPVDAEAGGIAADSLAPRRVGEIMFPIAQKFIDRVALVSDDAIRSAQWMLWNTLRVASEPGGAAALAGLLSSSYRPKRGERVGVLVSGGNTAAVDFG